MVQSQPNRTCLIIVPNETLELVEYRKHRESACSEYRQGFVLQISGGQCCVSNICNLTGKWTLLLRRSMLRNVTAVPFTFCSNTKKY